MEMTPRLFGGHQVRVPVSDQSHIGECRRVAQRLAEAARCDQTTAGRACIVATELSTNIIRHAGSGELLAQVLDDGAAACVEIIAIDQGRGMKNVDECLRDGFSTGGTPGNGLGAVSRMSSTFDIFSSVGQGSAVLSRISDKPTSSLPGPASVTGFEFGAICVALAGELECGDAWSIAESAASVAILVADGLGHGSAAARASGDAVKCFQRKPWEAPTVTMQTLHGALCGSRGAAAACASLDFSKSKVVYAGVGNISGHLLSGGRSRGMVSHNGTLGVQLLRAQQFEYDWQPNSRIVMHSDGLSGRWNIDNYPGLNSRHPAIIAGVLYRDFVRRRDDATIVVGCQR
jgi:anti-sigma regulatory factor (Ser/Thr protein kinase)